MKFKVDHSHTRQFSAQVEHVEVSLGDQAARHTFETTCEVDAYRKGLKDADRMLEKAHAAELQDLRAVMVQVVERARREETGITNSADRVLASIATAMRNIDIEQTLAARQSRTEAETQTPTKR